MAAAAASCAVPRCGAGKVCDTTTRPVQRRHSCTALASCTNGTGFNYCGKVGDGCGGSLNCSADLRHGQDLRHDDRIVQGRQQLREGHDVHQRHRLQLLRHHRRRLWRQPHCSTSCGAGKTCDTATGLCKGDSSCAPITACTNGTAFNYCGTVGDGCGGSLVCGADCAAGQICDTTTGLCKGDSTCTPITACTNGTAFNYCGTVGNSCGGSLTCSTACGTGQVCDPSKGLCKGDASCVPLT